MANVYKNEKDIRRRYYIRVYPCTHVLILKSNIMDIQSYSLNLDVMFKLVPPQPPWVSDSGIYMVVVDIDNMMYTSIIPIGILNCSVVGSGYLLQGIYFFRVTLWIIFVVTQNDVIVVSEWWLCKITRYAFLSIPYYSMNEK